MKKNKKIEKGILDLAYRVTGYDKEVIIEYVRLTGGKYSVFGDLTIHDFFNNSDKFKKILIDLHYLNRKMKINKILFR